MNSITIPQGPSVIDPEMLTLQLESMSYTCAGHIRNTAEETKLQEVYSNIINDITLMKERIAVIQSTNNASSSFNVNRVCEEMKQCETDVSDWLKKS